MGSSIALFLNVPNFRLMRILHLIQRYWPALGGAEGHLGELSARLAAEGHHVTVATTDALDFELFWDPRRRRVDRATDRHEEVRILRFPIQHLPFPHLAYPAWRRLLWTLSRFSPTPVTILNRLAQYTPWVPSLWHWLQETDEPFDLVAGMTICFEPFFSAGLDLARRRHIPFVAYPLTHLGAGPQPGQDVLSRFYTMRHQVAAVRESDALVAQTPAERAFYVQQGLPPQRAVVAGPGIDPAAIAGGDGVRFRQQHRIRGPLVASLSSMSFDKGTVHTVEAVRRLWRQGQDVELVLAGAVLAPFRRYLARLPTAERQRIHLLGPVDETTKRNLLAAMDLLVMPSRTDSFGIVYLEAWLYAKPVIGAQVWGIDGVIEHGRDGLLVPFGDIPALAAAIARLVVHPEERADLGRRGQAKTRRSHTWAHKYAITKELYERLTARRR